MKRYGFLLAGFLASLLPAAESEQAAAPTVDRVGFPKAYQEKYQVLRTVNKKEEQKVVTVYGNGQAASITNAAQLPYPNGSIIVMETASALKDTQGKPGDALDNAIKQNVRLNVEKLRSATPSKATNEKKEIACAATPVTI